MAQARTGQRVEVKVERHQLFLLFIIGLTVTALTFTLGVMMGKRLTGLSAIQAKGDIRQVDKAAEIERALKKSEAESPQSSASPSMLQQLAAAAKEKETAKAEKVKEPPAERPEKAEVAKAASDKPSERPTKNGKDREGKGPAIKEPKEPAETPAHGEAEFTLQIAALPDRNQAVALAAQMEKKGYRAHISTTQVPDKGTMYRVRIGHFKTKDEANAFRDEFQRKENRSGFVTPTK